MSYTKGPWKVVGLTHFFKQGDKLFVDGPMDANICPVEDERYSVAVIDGPDAIGNAHLIAAATDLLDALRALWCDIVEYNVINHMPNANNNHAMLQALAAMAKAEGK